MNQLELNYSDKLRELNSLNDQLLKNIQVQNEEIEKLQNYSS